nr:acyl-coenzyme A oxidase-like protein [Odocoileus virginianus texanus]
MTKKEDFFRAWNSCLHHITCLSLAHIHRVTLEQFCLAVRNCPDREDQALLKKFCLLYGTKLVFQERAWYLEHKYLTPMTSMRIRRQLLHLCDSVKDDALRVISAFNISHASLHAPIAGLANPKAAWVLYPAPQHSLAGERARSPRPKLGAKFNPDSPGHALCRLGHYTEWAFLWARSRAGCHPRSPAASGDSGSQ